MLARYVTFLMKEMRNMQDNKSRIINATLSMSAVGEMSIHFSTCTYLSLQHICSAAFFSRTAARIEKDYDNNLTDDVKIEYKAVVISSIFSAVSFLESTINEFFWKSSESPQEMEKSIGKDNVQLLSRLWNLKIPRTARYSILEKYEIALGILGKKPFDKDRSPYQDVALLIKIRNSLIHFEPEWVKDEEKQKMEKMLSSRFSDSPLVEKTSLYFPHRCLGHGCSEWAVNNSIKFSDEFCKNIGITPICETVRSKLKT